MSGDLQLEHCMLQLSALNKSGFNHSVSYPGPNSSNMLNSIQQFSCIQHPPYTSFSNSCLGSKCCCYICTALCLTSLLLFNSLLKLLVHTVGSTQNQSYHQQFLFSLLLLQMFEHAFQPPFFRNMICLGDKLSAIIFFIYTNFKSYQRASIGL